MAKSSPFPTAPDPADEPAVTTEPDEAQTEVGVSGQVSIETKVPSGEVNVTIKFGPGRDAPWLTFKAATLEGLADLIGYDREDERGPNLVIGLIEYIGQTERYAIDTYRKAVPATPVVGTLESYANKGGSSTSGGSSGSRPGKPAAATEPPAWMGSPPFCQGHGEKTKYVTGEKTNGDRWHAWGCPRSKDEGSCGLVFQNAPKS